eukprot:3936170-Rhodomonas_salina.1
MSSEDGNEDREGSEGGRGGDDGEGGGSSGEGRERAGGAVAGAGAMDLVKHGTTRHPASK